jgi:hypothetical protein
MKKGRAAGWFVSLMLSAHLGAAQAPAVPRHGRPPMRIMKEASKLTAYARQNVVPQRLAPADSVTRLLYVRNHVRTATLIRQSERFGPDTIEVVELDRRGNKIRIEQPLMRQRRLQRFDKAGHLVEVALPATLLDTISYRTAYDPRTKVSTTYLTAPGKGPVLWQQAQELRRGDTLSTEAIFQPVPTVDTGPTHRVVTRLYPLHADSTCLEYVEYDSADRPLSYSAFYQLRQGGQVSESGFLDFRSGLPPLPRKSREVAAELVRRSRQRRGRFIVTLRYVYDQRGQLAQQTSFDAPDSKWSSNAYSGMTTQFTRLPDGRIKREVDTFYLKPGVPIDARMTEPKYTEYEYGSNGLLLRKTDNRFNSQVTEYEVKYTYY